MDAATDASAGAATDTATDAAAGGASGCRSAGSEADRSPTGPESDAMCVRYSFGSMLHRELLVHNISHSDLLVAFPTGHPEGGALPSFILARPKYGTFQQTGVALMKRVLAQTRAKKLKLIRWRSKQGRVCSMGFDFREWPVEMKSWRDFHLKEHDTVTADTSAAPRVIAVFFPLLSGLLPKWLAVSNSFGHPYHPMLYLVSGSGTPQQDNEPVAGNSTESTSKLITEFVVHAFPRVVLQRVHSGPGVFRYDENVRFVNEQLQPIMEQHRRDLAIMAGEDWKKLFHVKVTLADGAPARVSAVTASLRRYRPDYFHVWQLKSFWHYLQLDEDDIDFVRFSESDTMPARPRASLDVDVRLLVEEMRSYAAQFFRALGAGAADPDKRDELDAFWLRKTKKPVLAVLMLRRSRNEDPEFFRGINMEVSMPTGSLCAERNVIGSALAEHLNLQRQHLRMVAVLSLSLERPESGLPDDVAGTPRKRPRLSSVMSADVVPAVNMNPIAPCGACHEWLKKIAEVNPDFKVVTFADDSCEQVFVQPVLD